MPATSTPSGAASSPAAGRAPARADSRARLARRAGPDPADRLRSRLLALPPGRSLRTPALETIAGRAELGEADIDDAIHFDTA